MEDKQEVINKANYFKRKFGKLAIDVVVEVMKPISRRNLKKHYENVIVILKRIDL